MKKFVQRLFLATAIVASLPLASVAINAEPVTPSTPVETIAETPTTQPADTIMYPMNHGMGS